MFKSEEYLDNKIRNDINEMYNILYNDCKDAYGQVNKTKFKKVSGHLKEKVSMHIDAVIDTYSKL